MLDERQKKLVKDYGWRFIDRGSDVGAELLHLSDDAASILTDEEWEPCKKAILKFCEEYNKLTGIVMDRIEEAGVE